MPVFRIGNKIIPNVSSYSENNTNILAPNNLGAITSVDISGWISGCDPCSYKAEMDDVRSSLSHNYEELTFSGWDEETQSNQEFSIGLVKLNNISFSNVFDTLGSWSASMSVFDEDFWHYKFKVTEPQDIFSYTDSEDMSFKVSRSCSARGLDFLSDPIAEARSFVDYCLESGYWNLAYNADLGSYLFTDEDCPCNNRILISEKETFNQIKGSYKKELDYLVDTSWSKNEHYKPDNCGSFIRFSSTIDHTESDFVKVIVDGSIDGGINSSAVNISDFNEDNAFVEAYMLYSNVVSDTGFYSGDATGKLDYLNPKPASKKITHNVSENLINFTYEFNDDPRGCGVINDYSINDSTDASQGCLVEFMVDGTIRWSTMPSTMSEEARMDSLESGFNDPFPLALKYFEDQYGSGYQATNLRETTSRVSKNIQSSTIDYSYSYDNAYNLPSGIRRFSKSISINDPIPKDQIIETICGGCIVTSPAKSEGKISINLDLSYDTGVFDYDGAKNYAELEFNKSLVDYVNVDKFYIESSRSEGYDSGHSSLSMSKSYVFEEEK